MRQPWYLEKSLAIFVVLLLNSFIYTPIVNAEDTDNDLVFIHHSCGQNWLNSSLHSSLLAKDYIDERNDIYYNTDVLPDSGRPDSLAPTPGDKTNMNHWILWFNDYLEGVKDHGCADGFNKIIMFKSCFSISNIVANGTEPGDPFSSTQTIVNYKAVYRHPNGSGDNYTYGGYIYKPLEDVFADNPDVLFIPVAAPPLCYNCTNDENAHRARVFNNWLKNEWLDDYNDDNPGLNNVAVYDWFNFLANPDDHPTYPNRLKAEYGGGSGNSHPNTLANQQSTQDFATNPDNFIDTKWNAYINESMVISNPSPSDGATDVSADLSELNVTIEDPEGDSFNWTIETSPDIGSASASGDSNGTKTCSISGLDFNTTYTWYVNVTDSGSSNWTNVSYVFTTVSNENPVFSNEDPYDGSIHVLVTISSLSVDIEDPEGDSFNWTIETSPNMGSIGGTGEHNGTKTCSVSNLSYNTPYTWYVNATDYGSGNWTNETFSFTTEYDQGASWDTGWSYYKTCNVANKSDDYQMFLNVTSSIGGDVNCSSHAQDDFDDLRFVYNNTIELPYWFEKVVPGHYVWVWINNSGNYSSFEMFYGNSSVGNTSNGTNTFLEFDDFSGDLSQWTIDNGGMEISSGTLRTPSDSTIDCYAHITNSNYTDIACDAMVKSTDFDYCRPAIFARYDGSAVGSEDNNFCYLRNSNEQRLYEKINGGYNLLATQSFTVTDDEWHFWSFRLDGSTITAYVRDESGNNQTTTAFDSTLTYGSVGVSIFGGVAHDCYWDNYRVRKYTNPEPSWSSFGSEQPVQPPIDTTPPEIVDNSPASGTTGDTYTFNVSVTDNVDTADELTVKVDWSHGSQGGNESMTNVGGNYFEKTVTLDQNSTSNMAYVLYANDTYGNTNTTTQASVTVQDNDNPSLVADNSDASGTTGDSFGFDVTVSDNVGVGSANVSWSHGSLIGNLALSDDGDGTWSGSVMLDDSLGNLIYRVQVNDTSGNYVRGSQQSKSVSDNDNPQVINVSATPSIQDIGGYVNITAVVTDNIAIGSIYLNITYPDSSIQNFSITGNKSGNTYYCNKTYTQVGTFTYFIWVNDTSNNTNTASFYTFEVTVAYVYVNDDYNSSTPGWNITHFDKIQMGIDAIVENGTVYVYNGVYYENVVVNKTVNLTGESEEATIIDGGGSGDVMYVYANWVNITGFTITNSGSSGDSGVDLRSNHSIITGNNILNNDYGIYLSNSSNNTIYNNYFNNTDNAHDDGSNTWNISKTFGTNIIGGLYLGGNYWQDYTGNDTDGDGLGDTPYYIPGGSNQDSYPLVSLPTTLRLVPENTTALGYTNVTYKLHLEYLQNGLSGYNITISISNSSVASIVSAEFPSWAIFHKNSSLPSDISWIKALDLNDEINGEVDNVLLVNITVRALNADTTSINLSITGLDDDNGYRINVQMQNSTLNVLYALPPLPGNQNPPTDPDDDGIFEDLNGNGFIDFDDVVQFFQHFEWIETNYPVGIIDVNGNGHIDYDDIVTLFEEL